ncbi:MAG: hypothetical protein JST86_01160 [Bacteroidetes bacterium]|nr:hypothetical protein [Bacteroidota bacterium]
MKGKKIKSIFLILVLAIQMLPVRQVIRYFFIDNPLTEELAHDAKGATKNFRVLDEDKVLHHYDVAVTQHIILHKESFFHFSETLPSLYSVEVPTPPPNAA